MRVVAAALYRKRRPHPAAATKDLSVTVIDFNAFIGRLATSSGETILPFFRTSLSIDNKNSTDFDPVTEADRAAEAVMRRLIKANFPSTALLARNSVPNAKTPEYVSGARPDRRHQVLHLRLPDLGHADRAAASGHTGLSARCTSPISASASAATAARRATRRQQRHPQACRAPLRIAERRHAVHHQPAADERRRSREISGRRKRRAARRATAAIAIPIACSPLAISTSSSRPS